MQPKAYILIGPPGSGKSTWVNSFLENTISEYVIVSSDAVLDEYAEQEGITYSEAFDKYAGQAKKEMNKRLQNAIINKKNIIWDQTNVSYKSRKKKIKSFENTKYNVYAVVFNVDEETIFNRIYNREKESGKHIPDKIVKDMLRNFEHPTNDEGFVDIYYIN